MTSVSGAASTAQQISPRDLLLTELQSQISTGEIASSDEDALASALEAIDSELAASRPEPGGTPPSPDEMQETIDGLIAEQVEAGTLTEEQAAELSGLFEDTFAEGPKGPPPPPPPGGATDTEETESADLLAEFLSQLQEASGSTGYTAGGDAASTSTAALLVDYTA